MAIEGHLLVAANEGFDRDLQGGLEHLDQAIALSAERPQAPRKFRQGNDPVVACYTTSAFILWMLGHPDRAMERADRAVALADESEHPFTLAYALFHSAVLHRWRREDSIVRDRAVGVLAVAEAHEFKVWEALGTAFLGAATTGLGQIDHGLDQLHRGLGLYRGLRSPPVFWPLLLYVEATADLQAARPTDGLRAIDTASEIFGEWETVARCDFEIIRGRSPDGPRCAGRRWGGALPGGLRSGDEVRSADAAAAGRYAAGTPVGCSR